MNVKAPVNGNDGGVHQEEILVVAMPAEIPHAFSAQVILDEWVHSRLTP